MTNIDTTLIARAVCVALVMVGGAAAHAQPPGDTNLDVTIRLLPENAVGPDEITRRIELPPAAASATPPRADAADEAPPDNDRGRGDEVSSEARERGREFGQEVSEQARQNRENAGRPDEPPGRPDDVGRPDDAGPPLDPPVSPPGGPPVTPPNGPPITPPGRP